MKNVSFDYENLQVVVSFYSASEMDRLVTFIMTREQPTDVKVVEQGAEQNFLDEDEGEYVRGRVREILSQPVGDFGSPLINAIKYYRGVTGRGLCESKKAVEKIRDEMLEKG